MAEKHTTTYDHDYAASNLWPTLNVLDTSGFSAYNIPETTALNGRTLTLRPLGLRQGRDIRVPHGLKRA